MTDQEYARRLPEFTDVIGILYREELGRNPEPGGLTAWLANARNGMTGEQMRAAIHDSAEAVLYRAKPVAPLMPRLEIRGRDFIDADGNRIVLNGCDAFMAYRLFLDDVDLDPFFEEARDLHFNMWRVFLMGSKRQNQVMDLSPFEPIYYDKLRPFVDLVNRHGILLLATVFVDAQDVMPKVEDRQQHWRVMAQYLRMTGTLLSLGNQASKNGFNPNEATEPEMTWSRGSDVADIPVYPNGASFAEFHPRRDLPAALMDTVASPVFLAGKGLTVPLVISEPPKFGTNGSGAEYADPFTAYRFARHYSTECAGAVFHSWFNQRGLLMDRDTRACAEAWSRGMRLC